MKNRVSETTFQVFLRDRGVSRTYRFRNHHELCELHESQLQGLGGGARLTPMFCSLCCCAERPLSGIDSSPIKPPHFTARASFLPTRGFAEADEPTNLREMARRRQTDRSRPGNSPARCRPQRSSSCRERSVVNGVVLAGLDGVAPQSPQEPTLLIRAEPYPTGVNRSRPNTNETPSPPPFRPLTVAPIRSSSHLAGRLSPPASGSLRTPDPVELGWP